METTPRGGMNKAGYLSTRWRGSSALAIWAKPVWVWSSRKQQLGIGMLGSLDNLFAWPPLDHLASIHHLGILRKVTSAGNIMSDKEECKLLFLFQAQQ